MTNLEKELTTLISNAPAMPYYRTVDYLIANGVTILPCKMGDEVWGIKSFNNNGKRVKKGIVHQMFYGEDMRLCIAVKGVCRGVWGEKVFATEEDARRALEGQNAIQPTFG